MFFPIYFPEVQDEPRQPRHLMPSSDISVVGVVGAKEQKSLKLMILFFFFDDIFFDVPPNTHFNVSLVTPQFQNRPPYP